LHFGAHRDDHADQLVTGDVRECYPVVMACPCVPVTATETGGVHLDNHAPGRWRRIGDRPDVHRTTELLEDRRAHEVIVPVCVNDGGPGVRAADGMMRGDSTAD
jgi:hypothetical protein